MRLSLHLLRGPEPRGKTGGLNQVQGQDKVIAQVEDFLHSQIRRGTREFAHHPGIEGANKALCRAFCEDIRNSVNVRKM